MFEFSCLWVGKHAFSAFIMVSGFQTFLPDIQTILLGVGRVRHACHFPSRSDSLSHNGGGVRRAGSAHWEEGEEVPFSQSSFIPVSSSWSCQEEPLPWNLSKHLPNHLPVHCSQLFQEEGRRLACHCPHCTGDEGNPCCARLEGPVRDLHTLDLKSDPGETSPPSVSHDDHFGLI